MGAFKTSLTGNTDGFVAIFNDLGARLYATYYGGEKDESDIGTLINGEGDLFIFGATDSTTNIATPGSSQPTFSNATFDESQALNGFLSRLDNSFLGNVQNDIDSSIAVYPNPNNGNFFIHSAIQETFQITLYDLVGRVVHIDEAPNSGSMDINIDLNETLSSGTYVGTITQKNGNTKNFKILIK